MKEALFERPVLVMSCSWCVKPGTEPALPKGQEYSHEICRPHLYQQLIELRDRARIRRRERVGGNLKNGVPVFLRQGSVAK